MKNNANLIIAAVLMMGFLLFWDTVVVSRYSPRPLPQKTVTSAVPAGSAEEKTLLATAQAATHNPDKESLTVLEADGVKISVMSRGAHVASWQIKEKDHWLELVVPEKERQRSPLETYPDLNFTAQKKSPSEAVFTAVGPDGLQIEKSIRLLSNPPFHEVTLSFTNPTAKPIAVDTQWVWGNGLDKHLIGTPYSDKHAGEMRMENRAVGLAAKIKSWKPGVIFGRDVDRTDPDSFTWVGVTNHHFLAALIAGDGTPFKNVHVATDKKILPVIAAPVGTTLGAGQRWQQSAQLYVGPKRYDQLKTFGHGLDQSVNFGAFGVIAKMLLHGLNFFHALTGNYGWAIILLTFSIQLLVFPLTKKNLQHAARMREFQPQIKKIQEQYKEDPKRQQVEMLNFYKRNGMKFMGLEGCFPMMLQIPVFLAFYAALQTAYELRGAPWIFWIKDLGAYDPYYALPIIMGIGMFLQQKLTAVAADPAQARMMMLMPVMFTFMFHKLPSGLVLYWCVNSLTTIVIQKLLSVKKDVPLQPAT